MEELRVPFSPSYSMKLEYPERSAARAAMVDNRVCENPTAALARGSSCRTNQIEINQ
jgi:hypothetical protein